MFDISRQSYYKYKNKIDELSKIDNTVLSEVLKLRQDHPKKKLQTLYRRLKNRNTEKYHEIEQRLFTSMEELYFLYKNNKFFDYVLVNGKNIDTSFYNLINIINKLYPKLKLTTSIKAKLLPA